MFAVTKAHFTYGGPRTYPVSDENLKTIPLVDVEFGADVIVLSDVLKRLSKLSGGHPQGMLDAQPSHGWIRWQQEISRLETHRRDRLQVQPETEREAELYEQMIQSCKEQGNLLFVVGNGYIMSLREVCDCHPGG